MGTSTAYSSDAAAAVLVAAGAYLGVLMVIALAVGILEIIANWKVFTKAGEAGWKSIIPIYNLYIQAKIAWKNTTGCYVYALGALVISVVLSFVSGAGNDAAPIIGMICVVLLIALCVLHILIMVKLARAFGKGGGFAVGLILLPTIFTLILGFGSAEYVGAQD